MNSYVRKTYIEFLYPLTFHDRCLTRKVKTRDLSRVKTPKDAIGFRFFDIFSTVVVDVDGMVVELTSERINVSPTYYRGGKLYTVAELKRDFPNRHMLIMNIEDNGYKRVIRYRNNRWLPLKETDIFVAGTL